jgi:transcription elongation factor Elf1
MAIKKANLTKDDRKFLERFTCLKKDCDEHIKITTTDFDLAKTQRGAKVYAGSCKRCGKFFQLTEGQFSRWRRIFENADVQKVEHNFDKLFE